MSGLKSGKKGITNARLITAMRKHAGLMSLIAADLDCSVQNVHQRIRRSKELQREADRIDEQALDLAYGTVINGIKGTKDKGGDLPTARWFLQQKGQSRGFGRQPPTMVTVHGAGAPPPTDSPEAPEGLTISISAADAEM